MTKLKALFDKTKYALLLFAVLVFNSVVVVGGGHIQHIYAVTYSMYLLDYSFGFCARFFPGQLYRWITGGNYSMEAVQSYCVIVLLVAFVLLAVLLNLFILSAPEKERKLYVILALFFVSGPVTFSLYSYAMGIIDTLWIIFTPVVIFLLGNRYTKYFAPLFIVPMVLVHFSAITCYVVLVLFILLYRASEEKSKTGKAVYSAMFAFSLLIAVGITVYFIMFESSNIKYTAEEMIARAKERSEIGEYTDLLYVNFDIFKIVTFQDNSIFDGSVFPYKSLKDDILIPEGSSLPQFVVNAVNAVWPNIDFHLKYYGSKGRIPDELTSVIKQTVFISPVLAFVFGYWRHRIRLAKENKNRFQQLLFSLAITYFPVALVFWFMCSIDHFRYYNHIMIVEGAFMLYVMYCNREDTALWLEERFGKMNKGVLFLYAVIYFITGRISV
ncbi:MAG: hypothetical protein II744_05525 [Eubacterium sp.]|nr:hypothetical protein [Eubacterium sp.]